MNLSERVERVIKLSDAYVHWNGQSHYFNVAAFREILTAEFQNYYGETIMLPAVAQAKAEAYEDAAKIAEWGGQVRIETLETLEDLLKAADKLAEAAVNVAWFVESLDDDIDSEDEDQKDYIVQKQTFMEAIAAYMKVRGSK